MRYSSLFALLFLLASCSKDEVEQPAQIIDNGGLFSIAGEWHLHSIMSFSPITMVFEPGDYVWNIPDTQDSIAVTQTIDLGAPFIEIEGDQTVGLTVMTDSLLTEIYDYGYFLEDSSLYVTNGPELDGPIYQFIHP